MLPLVLIACLLAGSAFGQGFTLQDTAFLGVLNRGVQAAGAFYPTNIANCAFYVSYLDLAPSSTVTSWKNEMPTNQVFTGTAATAIQNTTSGVYFPGTAPNYLTNLTSVISWQETTDSVWIALKPERVTGHAYDAILCSAYPSGHGLYVDTGNFVLDSTAHPISPAVIAVAYDICVLANAGGTSPTYTNGVAALSVTVINTGEHIWGIGVDADSDNNFNGYIKFIAVFTNYTLTASDIANLHAYATSH